MKIGFIGTGTMGQPMLGNLLKKRFDVIAFDIVPSALDAAVKLGAARAASGKGAGAARDPNRLPCLSKPGVAATFQTWTPGHALEPGVGPEARRSQRRRQFAQRRFVSDKINHQRLGLDSGQH